MRRYGRSVLLFALILVLAAGPAHAGGLWLSVQPTPDMGVAGAGSQAAGFDASTATANPAAMTRLDRSQMEVGIMGIYPDMQFNVKNATFGGNDGGNAGFDATMKEESVDMNLDSVMSDKGGFNSSKSGLFYRSPHRAHTTQTQPATQKRSSVENVLENVNLETLFSTVAVATPRGLRVRRP